MHTRIDVRITYLCIIVETILKLSIQDLRLNLRVMQYFLSVECLNDAIQEFSQSINKDPGHSCVEVKLLLLKHGELCYTTETFKQQVCVFVCMYWVC